MPCARLGRLSSVTRPDPLWHNLYHSDQFVPGKSQG